MHLYADAGADVIHLLVRLALERNAADGTAQQTGKP